MTERDPIEVVVVTPPRSHPLAGALRAIVERVARRPGVVVSERAGRAAGVGAAKADDGEALGRASSAATGERRVRLVAGLEVSAADVAGATLGLGLEVVGEWNEGTAWVVPADAFGRAIDGVERVQRLGSLLAACLDLAGTAAGREVMRTDAAWTTPGVTQVLAGTAHLSARALDEALARGLAAKAAGLLAASLEEGREWAIDDWELPAEVVVESVIADISQGKLPGDLRARALSAVEGLTSEVLAAVDQALATHGLGALIPLQAAIDRLLLQVRRETERDAPRGGAQMPVLDAVRAAEARVRAVPEALPGSMLLAYGWAAPTGALAGLALGPALSGAIAGSGYALSAAGGTAAFIGFAGLARGWSALRRRVARASLATAEADFAAAQAAIAKAEHEALGPEIVRSALSWFRDQLSLERRRLMAVEAHVRLLGRTHGIVDTNVGEPLAAGRDIDAAVDLSAARKLIDPAPEPLVQRVRSEIGTGWREGLPTLLDLVGAARGLSNGRMRAPWVERSDLAAALVAALGRALEAVERGLERIVPRGLPVRRVRLLPAPFDRMGDRKELASAGGEVLPSAGDAHLLVLWRQA